MADKQAPYKMTGTVEAISEVNQVTEKFAKRTLVVTTGGKYPKPISFDFGNEAILQIDGARIGDECEVRFYLNGYTWEKDSERKYGVGLKGVEYAVVAGSEPAPAPADDDDKNLPF